MASKLFTFMQWNCRGIKLKWFQFRAFVVKNKPDICILNETGFSPQAVLPLSSYHAYSVWGSGRWGTTIYVRSRRLAHAVLYRSAATDHMETLLIKFHHTGQTFTLCGSYWPPTYRPLLAEWHAILAHKTGLLIMAGDFNAHHQSLLNSAHTDHKGRMIANIAQDEDLQIHTAGPTWFRPHCQPATLYLFLSPASCFHRFAFHVTDDPLDSDHLPILLTLGQPCYHSTRKCTDWARFRDIFDTDLPPETSNLSQDLETFHTHFQDSIHAATEKIKQRNCGGRLPFWSLQCEHSQRRSRAAWQRYRRSGRTDDYISYRRIQAESKKLIKSHKRQAFENFTANVNATASNYKVWRYLHVLSHPESPPPISDTFQLHGKTAAETETEVTEFFEQVFGASLPPLPPFTPVPDPPDTATPWFTLDSNFSLAELKYAIQNTPNRSPGDDGITAQAIKQLSPTGQERLLDLFNACWSSGVVPTMWKTGVICDMFFGPPYTIGNINRHISVPFYSVVAQKYIHIIA